MRWFYAEGPTFGVARPCLYDTPPTRPGVTGPRSKFRGGPTGFAGVARVGQSRPAGFMPPGPEVPMGNNKRKRAADWIALAIESIRLLIVIILAGIHWL